MLWSKSRLKTMRDCPKKYNLHYHDKIRMPTPEALDKGIKLHDLYENFFLSYKGDLQVALKDAIEKTGLTKQFVAKYMKYIETFMQNNVEKLEDFGEEQFMPVATEEKYTYGGWIGIIDRVDKINGKHVLIDYKTSQGKSLAGYHDELLLYAWMFEQEHNIKIDMIGIFFTKNGALVLEPVQEGAVEENLEDLNNEAKVYEKAIENGMYPINPGFWCNWCSYKGTEYCTEAMRSGETDALVKKTLFGGN